MKPIPATGVDRRVFGTLFFALLATITGVGIVVPLLPVYAESLGAGGLYIGLIFGAFSLSRTFMLPYFGRLSDRRGRKPIIIAGLAAYAAISVAFVLSSTVEHLIVIRFCQGIASAMIMPVVQAYVGDIAPAGREGFSMGMFNTSLFLGLSIGPVAGGLINDAFSMAAAFYWMGALCLVAVVLCLWMLPPTADEPAMVHGVSTVSYRAMLADATLVALFVFRFAYTACIGIIWGFLPVLAATELSLSSARIGVLVMLGVMVSGLVHTPMGYLADRLNRRVMVIGGGLVVCAALVAYGRADEFGQMFAASVLFGLGGGVAMPALMAMAVNEGQKADAMGSVMAALTVAHSLGMMTGALLAGLLMDWFALRLAFDLGAVIMAAGVAGFGLLQKGRPSL